MLYEVGQVPGGGFWFETDTRARRGRGVLFATAPLTVYVLAVAVMFVVTANDLTLWTRFKQAAAWGGLLAAGLTAACFVLGYRIRDRVEVSRADLTLRHRPALGGERTRRIAFEALSAFAIDPALRSLGADLLLVAVRRDGVREPVAEGDPHVGQLRELGVAVARAAGLPLEAPRHTTGAT